MGTTLERGLYSEYWYPVEWTKEKGAVRIHSYILTYIFYSFYMFTTTSTTYYVLRTTTTTTTTTRDHVTFDGDFQVYGAVMPPKLRISQK